MPDEYRLAPPPPAPLAELLRARRTTRGAHALRPVTEGDRRERAAEASLADREWLRTAPAILVLSADLATVNEHFADQPPRGRRGTRYAWLKAGHASQSGYLWAAAEGLAFALVGGFEDERLRAVLPPAHDPLALIAVGHPDHR